MTTQKFTLDTNPLHMQSCASVQNYKHGDGTIFQGHMWQM